MFPVHHSPTFFCAARLFRSRRAAALNTAMTQTEAVIWYPYRLTVQHVMGKLPGQPMCRRLSRFLPGPAMPTAHWSEPLTLHCRRLFLRNYDAQIRIGAHDAEKRAPQRVRFNVDIYVLLRDSCPKQDSLDEVVDYDLIRSTIIARTARGHLDLQETLCDDVANALLQHPKVCAVRVSTEKPDAYADCEAVGVEIFHIKPNVIPGLAPVANAIPTSD